MTTVTETKATHVAMSAEEYHANGALGAGMLEDFRESRRKFYALHVAKTMAKPPATPAMSLGTLVHTRLLEPQRYADELAEPMPEFAPDGTLWNKRLKAHREAWANEELKRAGSNTIDHATAAKVEAIAAAVLENWHARRLLERDGSPEFSIFWTDQQTGLALKCRVDWMATLPVDIKTTRDPSPAEFSKSIVNFGYHRSRAHYMAGIHNYRGESVPMVHLAVGTESPHQVVVYDIDDTDATTGQSLGYFQWRQTLAAITRCHDTNDWRDPHEKTIVSVRLPGWAFGQDAYSFLGE